MSCGFEAISVIPVVVAPTFNNANTLLDVLQQIHAQGFPVIVINDGSTDNTMQILGELNQPLGITVLQHEHNRGKAAALQTGFATAIRAGYTHAITIDTDGQHDPAQILQLLGVCKSEPASLVLGTRDASSAGYPLLSRLGRRFSNLMIRLQSGACVEDSQCGMRVYPLMEVNSLRCVAGRYGFETEILTRAAWAKIPIVSAPIACRYFPASQRVSHFRPFMDSLRALGMHARLMPRAAATWPRRLAHWLSPIRLLRDMRSMQAARSKFAAGLALGVFIACLPAYGFQSVLSLFAARRFKLHPLSVLAGSHLSTPPVSPILIVISLALGHFLLHGTWPRLSAWHFSSASITPAILRSLLLEWIIGGIALGAALALLTYPLVYAMLHFAWRQPSASTTIS
jgi:uncharacterized protein (DUF2062 family)